MLLPLSYPLLLPFHHRVSPPSPVYLVCGFNLDVVREVWSGGQALYPSPPPRSVLHILRLGCEKPGVADGGNSDSVFCGWVLGIAMYD